MKIHIRGSGAPELTKVFEESFENQLPSRTTVTYDWSQGAGEVPPGWTALQKALEGAVQPSHPTKPSQPSFDPGQTAPNPPPTQTGQTADLKQQTPADAAQSQVTADPAASEQRITQGSALSIRAQLQRDASK